MRTLITLLMIVASFLLIGWLGRPLWDDVRVVQEELTRVNNALNSLEQKKELFDNLIATYNGISQVDLDRLLEDHLPNRPETGSLLVALEQIARDNHVTLHSTDFKITEQKTTSTKGISKSVPPKPGIAPKEKELPVAEVTISLSISASYQNFKEFLGALENHVRLIDVQSISFGSAGISDPYRFTIAAKTYYRK